MNKESIAKLIAKELGKDHNEILALLAVPPSMEFGDFALPCFSFSKDLKKSPQKIAEELCEKLMKDTTSFKKIEVKGGYLNFFIDRELKTLNVLSRIIKEENSYGSSDIGKGKVVVIDFSSPNIAKPIGLQHLRSTMIGNSISNTLEFLSYDVKRINYIGDWGTTFGELLTAYTKWGNEKKLYEKGVLYLVELYQLFQKETLIDQNLDSIAREWFKKTEEGDKEALKLWKIFRDISIREFEKIYSRLGVRFDSFEGESSVNDVINETIELLNKKIGLKKSEGAEVIELEDKSLPPVLIRKTDGATLYATRDIATAIKRKRKYDFHENLYVVAVQQNLHFEAVFKVLEKLEFKWKDSCKHIAFGMMLFNDKKMATRTGNIVFLEDVLNKAKELALHIINEKNATLDNKDEVAEMVGMGAIVFNDLKNKKLKNVNFTWEEALNFDGETGPYVQYTFARINSIIAKSGLNIDDIFNDKDNFKKSTKLLISQEEISLIKILSQFGEIVKESAKDYEPSTIAKYLLDLVSAFNTFYNVHKVISQDTLLMQGRLSLIYSVNQVIFNSAKLLGIRLPERM